MAFPRAKAGFLVACLLLAGYLAAVAAGAAEEAKAPADV